MTGGATGRGRRPRGASVLLAALAVASMSATAWQRGNREIDAVLASPAAAERLVSGDSRHYLDIAAAFRRGDFGMDHVTPTGRADRGHRQPGFPAVLAAAAALGAGDPGALARVNVAILAALPWIAFVGAALATASPLAGLVAAAVVFDAAFLPETATRRLLSEPLYVAVALAAVAAALAYARRPSTASLFAVAVFAGLAYTVRVNGLFLAASLVLVVAGSRPAPRAAARSVPAGVFAAAFGLFLLASAPSWVPRAVHAGNPLYHGYLPNYLWVDDYDRAHVPGPPRFGWSDYAREHDAADALRRMGWGLRRVFWETPRDKFGRACAAAIPVAALLLLALRDRPGILLAVAGLLQALPLAWTAMANPARRIPAAALLPFAALLLAAAAAGLLGRAAQKRGRPVLPRAGLRRTSLRIPED